VAAKSCETGLSDCGPKLVRSEKPHNGMVRCRNFVTLQTAECFLRKYKYSAYWTK
jgi:hypothetical protein